MHRGTATNLEIEPLVAKECTKKVRPAGMNYNRCTVKRD